MWQMSGKGASRPRVRPEHEQRGEGGGKRGNVALGSSPRGGRSPLTTLCQFSLSSWQVHPWGWSHWGRSGIIPVVLKPEAHHLGRSSYWASVGDEIWGVRSVFGRLRGGSAGCRNVLLGVPASPCAHPTWLLQEVPLPTLQPSQPTPSEVHPGWQNLSEYRRSGSGNRRLSVR